MIKGFELSLWELFVYLTTSIFAILLISVHLFLAGEIDLSTLKILKDLPSPLLVISIPFLLLLIGLIIEPFANFFEKQVFKPIRKRLKLKTNKDASDESSLLKSYIEERYLDLGLKETRVETYHICKDYLVQNQIPTPYMAFLSKFGFYRNMSFLCYLSMFLNPLLYNFSCISFLVSLCFGLTGFLFERRSIVFYGHMSATIFRNYIIHKVAQETKISVE